MGKLSWHFVEPRSDAAGFQRNANEETKTDERTRENGGRPELSEQECISAESAELERKECVGARGKNEKCEVSLKLLADIWLANTRMQR